MNRLLVSDTAAACVTILAVGKHLAHTGIRSLAMKILLTGFDPFGIDTVNPALEAVKLVSGNVAGAQIIKQVVPTAFGKSIDVVYNAMKEHKPDAVLCIGQAGGRFALTPEKVAINFIDARINDNEGCQPFDAQVFEDGPDAYFSTLPIKAMVNEIQACGIPAQISYSAGTFVCNSLMYGVLYHIAHELPSMRGGFMHVPFIPEQVLMRPSTPSMALSDITSGIEAAIKAIVEN